jgi:glyoxylase-like metal-dependent hydrolase (beta-lactamase superfamily II)
MAVTYHVLLEGFPGTSSRGFLGFSFCAVLITSKRIYLFDTGGYGERRTILEKLKQLKIAPQEIDVLILSHLHFDHIVNFGLFQNAEIIFHELELKHVMQNKDDIAVPYEVLPGLFARKFTLLSGATVSLDELTFVHTPGHSPGHLSLFFQHNEQTVCFAADAVKNIGELLTGRVMMTQNEQDTLASIRLIRERADLIYPGHDAPIVLEKGVPKQRTFAEVTLHPAEGFHVYAQNGTLRMIYGKG